MTRAFTIAGDPVGKERPRISKHGGMYTPKKTRDYEKLVAKSYMAEYRDVEPFDKDVPLDVTIIAYFEIPKSDTKIKKEKKRNGEMLPVIKCDIDNICKIILDGVQGVAFYDDKQVVDISAIKRYADDPRVEVTINEHEGNTKRKEG